MFGDVRLRGQDVGPGFWGGVTYDWRSKKSGLINQE